MFEIIEESTAVSEARKIFNHLLMFQFYRDLKNYDKTLTSIYEPHSLSVNEELDVPFLKDWMTEFAKDEKCEILMQNIENCELTSIKITIEEFERKFEEVFPPALPEYGGGFLARIAVRNKAISIFYLKVSY